jgi:DNA-binding transcriptional LysR family regulator
MPSPIIVEVNSAEWGINLVENGEGVGFHHIKSVERPIAEGRLKILQLNGDIFVGAQALLLNDAPEHPMAPEFIALVKDCLSQKQVRTAPRLTVVK